MTLEQLKTLCAVVDLGSFAAAADAVGLTQPALSMQLAKLEDEAGLSLFLKTGRRKVLGAEGLVVLANARRILADVKALEGELQALRGLDSGTLAIAAADTVLRHLLADPLAAFSFRWPNVHLHVWNRTSAEVIELVRDGRADLGVLTLPSETAPAGDLEIRPWKSFQWVAAAPASIWSDTRPVSIGDLLSHTLVLLEPGTRLHSLWTAACRDRGLAGGRHVETGSTDIQLDFAARGLGVALVPDYAGARADLVVRPVPELGTGDLALVQRRGRLPRAAEAFLTSFPSRPAAR